jgi:hypothetical protein
LSKVSEQRKLIREAATALTPDQLADVIRAILSVDVDTFALKAK